MTREDALTLKAEIEKIGKWIRGGYDDYYYVCSKCGYKATEYWIKPKYNYCPNCGAKMAEPQESEG